MASHTISSPSPEELAQLNTLSPGQVPPTLYPSSQQAQELAVLGLGLKAYNLYHCGRYAREFQCPTGHKWNAARTCKERFCKDCAQRIAENAAESYKHVLALIESAKEGQDMGKGLVASGKFQFLALRVHCKRSARELDKLADRVRRGLRSLIPKGHRYATKVWFRMVAFDSGTEMLTVRILWWGENLSPEAFHAALPSVETCLTRDNYNIRGYFARLVEPMIPQDSRERGRQEAAFDGVKQLRSIGTLHFSDLFPSNKPLGNNVTTSPESEGATVEDTESLDPKCPVCRPKCPYCHQKAARYTDYKLRGSPGTWHDF